MSHYMLSVTPPILDCESGSGDSGSEFMINKTHFNLIVTAEQIYSLNISVINSCGDIGEVAEYVIDTGGIKYWLLLDKEILVSIGDAIDYSFGGGRKFNKCSICGDQVHEGKNSHCRTHLSSMGS